MEVLFSEQKSAGEKEEILKRDYDISMTDQFEREVYEMCNLSEGILERGIEQGMQQGIEQGMQRGWDLMNALYGKLIEDNRIEDIKRATQDVEYQRQLMQEYRIDS
ncbi:MAG: hypothetical protein PUB24_06410 [Lachnospiraceae bacterium]|nr:hypothetical protein [Lachnospiraceae bacterium]